MPTRSPSPPVRLIVPTAGVADAAHGHATARGGVVPGGCSRVAVILALVPLIEAFGVPWAELLREAGLRSDQFDDPEQLIPFRQGSRFLGLCADRSGCAHLGVLTGGQTPLESLGIVAELARAAPDVRTALGLMSRFLTLSDGGGLATLTEDARFATYGYALYEPGVERAEIIYDHVLGVTWNALRALCGAPGCRTRCCCRGDARPTLDPIGTSFARRCASTPNNPPSSSTRPGSTRRSPLPTRRD